MRVQTISVFPGQGSQFVGMGLELFRKYRHHDNLAKKILGYSLSDLCNGATGDLMQTSFTQPALFVVNVLQYLEDLDCFEKRADMFAGHSLGEYCALFAAGAFDFETALRVVQERGRLMASCQGGKMAAIKGVDRSTVESLIEDSPQNSIAISNINSPLQHVVSGTEEDIVAFEEYVLKAGAGFYVLDVSGAFHSQAMAEIAEQFQQYLSGVEIFPLKVPVLSNVTAEFYEMDRRDHVVELLVKQLYSPVQWQQCMENIPECGEIVFREHGSKPVLTKLAQQIFPEIKLVLQTHGMGQAGSTSQKLPDITPVNVH